MTQTRAIPRDLAIAAAIQFLALAFGAITLDMGQMMSAIARVSIGFWLGVVIILSRRHNSLTRRDHAFLQFGLVPLLVVCVPIALSFWAYRGAR